MAEIDTEGIGIVIELKYADDGDLDGAPAGRLWNR